MRPSAVGVALVLVSACSGGASIPVIAPVSGLAAVVRGVEPSIVTITTRDSVGSGVVYTRDGLVITDEHVVRGAKTVDLAFADGLISTGEVVATDPVSDVAVVQSARAALAPAVFRRDSPDPGDTAVAIGSPLGLTETVTSGIVSGLHRVLPAGGPRAAPLVDLVQTDAPISPGNSGGALLDGQGRVIGVNEAYVPPTAGAVAIGFATPTAEVLDVVSQLVKTGRALHAYLGLAPRTLTPEVARVLHVTVPAGVVVLSVAPGGPAAKAGVLPGDVLVEFGGVPVRTADDLLVEVRLHRPADVVDVTVHRGPDLKHVSVVLSAVPS